MDDNKKTVFLVDDDIVNLTAGNNVLSAVYNVFTVNSGKLLFKMLEKRVPDLILLDVEMPEMNGYETIEILKKDESSADIPVIFLTAKNDGDNELKGLTLGAIDYIVKPFIPSLLLKRIEVHLLVESQKKELALQRNELLNFNNNLQKMVEEKTETVVELQNAVMNTFAELIECRDDVTGGHIGRTQRYMNVLISATKTHPLYCDEIGKWVITLILQSAQLHDVGKIAIKDAILQKAGKLTELEYETIKEHVAFGEIVIDRIMSNTKEQEFLKQAKIMVSTHHERWDGLGYPNKLKGKDIPLQGRMMAIVDVYDALVSDRPYKKAFSHDEAVRMIAESSGKQFDPDLVDVFLSTHNVFEEISKPV